MSRDKRVQFDFDIEFLNGGGLQGQGFRLDIDGQTIESIDDQALADYIVRDLRLLLVGSVRISNKTLIEESHKRAAGVSAASATPARTFVDLSHTIENGMITYRGLPAPLICDHLSREQSRQVYAPGTEFQIDSISMVGNTGTYIDSPLHRFADGVDIAGLQLESLTDLEGIVVRVTGTTGRAIPRGAFLPYDIAGRAVLVHTGWDRHWRTDRYFEGHPYLTADAAEYLQKERAALVGIDSLNIDDTADPHRPVHTTLLGAGIPIVEHLCDLDRLPAGGFQFSAVPAKLRRVGTFPVRAFAKFGK